VFLRKYAWPRNGAFKVVNETFRGNAVGVSSEALGLARAAYEIALQYANERTSGETHSTV